MDTSIELIRDVKKRLLALLELEADINDVHVTTQLKLRVQIILMKLEIVEALLSPQQ